VGGITVDGSGNVYVTARADRADGLPDDTVVRFDPAGALALRFAPVPGQPAGGGNGLRGVAVASDGSIWVGTSDPIRDSRGDRALLHFSAAGTPIPAARLSTILSGQGRVAATGVESVVFANGLLYIAGHLSSRH